MNLTIRKAWDQLLVHEQFIKPGAKSQIFSNISNHNLYGGTYLNPKLVYYEQDLPAFMPNNEKIYQYGSEFFKFKNDPNDPNEKYKIMMVSISQSVYNYEIDWGSATGDDDGDTNNIPEYSKIMTKSSFGNYWSSGKSPKITEMTKFYNLLSKEFVPESQISKDLRRVRFFTRVVVFSETDDPNVFKTSCFNSEDNMLAAPAWLVSVSLKSIIPATLDAQMAAAKKWGRINLPDADLDLSKSQLPHDAQHQNLKIGIFKSIRQFDLEKLEDIHDVNNFVNATIENDIATWRKNPYKHCYDKATFKYVGKIAENKNNKFENFISSEDRKLVNTTSENGNQPQTSPDEKNDWFGKLKNFVRKVSTIQPEDLEENNKQVGSLENRLNKVQQIQLYDDPFYDLLNFTAANDDRKQDQNHDDENQSDSEENSSSQEDLPENQSSSVKETKISQSETTSENKAENYDNSEYYANYGDYNY